MGCNLKDCSMTVLSRHFAMMMLVEGSDDLTAKALEDGLAEAEATFDLTVPARPVLRLPDHILKQVADPVEKVGAGELGLAMDLLDTMAASPSCVGVAAPQIGVSLRAFRVDVTGHRKADSCHGAFVLFNPVLLAKAHLEVAREGCMSVPDLTGNVARATEVVVRGLTPEGDDRVIEANAF